MNFSEEYINRILKGKGTDNERRHLARFLKENASEAEKLFSEQSWKAAFAGDSDLDAQLSHKMLQHIHLHTFQKSRNRRLWLYRISAAAAIIAGVYLYFSVSSGSASGELAAVTQPAQTEYIEITRSNTTSAIEHIALEDGSIVELYPNSSLTYLKGFTPEKRDLELNGKAVFQVYKDAGRPFTVYSNEVATTALGTKFMVSTSGKNTSVMLYRGKILVRRDSLWQMKNGSIPQTLEDENQFYLTPGNEITYYSDLRKFSAITNFTKAANAEKRVKFIPEPRPESMVAVELNNIPLSTALDELAEKYQVKIQYSPSDVHNINIIATLNRSQPIAQILDDIAQMNNLEVTQTPTKGFIITKAKSHN